MPSDDSVQQRLPADAGGTEAIDEKSDGASGVLDARSIQQLHRSEDVIARVLRAER